MEKSTIAMLCLGIMVGLIFPGFPAPLDIIRPYLWLVFFVIAIILFVKK